MENLNNMYSPCIQCYIHSGHSYSPDDTSCQRCEYALTMSLFRSACNILRGHCGYCIHYPEGCSATINDCEWHINWNETLKDFNIEI